MSSTALDNSTACNKSNVFISKFEHVHQTLVINEFCIKAIISSNSTYTSFKIWYQRLGHAFDDVLKYIFLIAMMLLVLVQYVI